MAQSNAKKNMPSHRIYVVEDYEKDGEQKSAWTEVGVAFPTKGGVACQVKPGLSISGRFLLRDFEPRNEDG